MEGESCCFRMKIRPAGSKNILLSPFPTHHSLPTNSIPMDELDASTKLWILTYLLLVISFTLVSLVSLLFLFISFCHSIHNCAQTRTRIILLILLSSMGCALMHVVKIYREFYQKLEDFALNYVVYSLHVISEMAFFSVLLVLLFLMIESYHSGHFDKILRSFNERAFRRASSGCSVSVKVCNHTGKFLLLAIINISPLLLTLLYFLLGVKPAFLYFSFIIYFFLLVVTNQIVFCTYGFMLYRKLKLVLADSDVKSRRYAVILGVCLLTHLGQTVLTIVAMPSVLIKSVEERMTLVNIVLYLMHYVLELVIVGILLVFGKTLKRSEGRRRWGASRTPREGDISFEEHGDGNGFLVDHSSLETPRKEVGERSSLFGS